jgi:CheY-like chemotaxis protein/signal transduction histidine kinase
MKKNYLILVIGCFFILFILSLTYFSIWWVVLAMVIGLACLAYRIYYNRVNLLDARNTELEMQLAEKSEQLDKGMRNEKNMRSKMEEIQKSKTTVLNKISHEIRSPMNGMMGMASLLGQTVLNIEQKEYLETIRSCGKNMITTINDILLKDTLSYALEKNDKTGLERVNFNVRSCIEDALDFFSAKGGKEGVELMCWVSYDIPEYLSGDEGRLRQVLLNLIENSLTHTTSGDIFVGVTLQEPINKGEMNLAFEVKDTGSGIQDAELKAIMQRLQGAGSPHLTEAENTGLGLIITDKLVKTMGGKLHLKSKPTAGTTVYFNIIAGYATILQKRNSLENFTGLAGKTILLLVNNPSVGDILAGHLEHWNINIILARSGNELLQLLSSDTHVDLLLQDSKIPGMDAVELTQSIHQQYPDLPIILMNDAGDENYKSCAGLYTSVLSKPVRQNILFSLVLSVLIPQDRSIPKEQSDTLFLSDKFSEKYPMHILIAEDNPINQQFAVKILNRLGYKPEVANNGEEVLEIVSQENFDLILMDVEMPGMDGLEATRMIRLCLELQPVIIAMTANAMQGDREICLQSGMDDYLSKPVELEELIGILEKWALQVKVNV